MSTQDIGAQDQTNEPPVDETGMPIQDEMTSLKARADLLGITYHPSIGLEKLREKVNAAATAPVGTVAAMAKEEAPEPNQPYLESDAERRNRKRREANELVRINVQCMNPAKKEWEGELFTSGNSLVGSFTKFVPFNTTDGWHVPRIIYNVIKERQCQTFTTVVDARGNKVRRGKLIKEFAVELLDQLSTVELKDLAQRQAMAKTID